MTKVFIRLQVYNSTKYFETALHRFASQTYRDFRVLIADNASIDQTEEFCRRFAVQDIRFTHHRYSENLGAAPNFGFCVEQALGNYFKWTAHDYLCPPEYLEKCVKTLDQGSGALLAPTWVKCINDKGLVTDSYAKEWDFNNPDPVQFFARAIDLNHACGTAFGLMRLEISPKPVILLFVDSNHSPFSELTLHGRRLEYVLQKLFLWRDHKNRPVRLKARRAKPAWSNTNTKTILPSLYSQQFWTNQKAAMRARLPLTSKARAPAKSPQGAAWNHQVLMADLRSLSGRPAPSQRVIGDTEKRSSIVARG